MSQKVITFADVYVKPRKLKSMGVLSVGQIAETTGLSVEEVEKLW